MSLNKKQTERTFEKYLEAKEEGVKDAWTPDISVDILEVPEPEPEPDLMEEFLDENPEIPQGDPEPVKPADIPNIVVEDPSTTKLAFEYISEKWGRTREEARKRLTEAGHDADAVLAKARAILRGED